MKKEADGIVIEVRGEIALVRPVSNAGEITCSCHDDDIKKPLLEVKNEIGAAVGDIVVFEDMGEGSLAAAFLMFIMPLIMVIGGSAAGCSIAPSLSINPTAAAVAVGVLSFLISLVIIKTYNNSMAKSGLMPAIIKKFPERNLFSDR